MPNETTAWQPIETAPVNVTCLFYEKPVHSIGDRMMVGLLDEDMYFRAACIDGWEWDCDMEKPTHWMPLPEPPHV